MAKRTIPPEPQLGPRKTLQPIRKLKVRERLLSTIKTTVKFRHAKISILPACAVGSN